jgi:hypothetical protein
MPVIFGILPRDRAQTQLHVARPFLKCKGNDGGHVLFVLVLLKRRINDNWTQAGGGELADCVQQGEVMGENGPRAVAAGLFDLG